MPSKQALLPRRHISAEYLFDGARYHTSAERVAPISFHHLSAETAATLDKMHLVVDTDARGRVWQYDFSDVSFGEHRFSPVGSREELRLLFGFHVDAREPNAPPLSANSAHSGWRTLYDNLRSFRRVGSSFEMELGVTPPVDTRTNARVKPTYPFPRDTCPDHRPGEVRLKRALVKVRCGAPCGSGGSDATAGEERHAATAAAEQARAQTEGGTKER